MSSETYPSNQAIKRLWIIGTGLGAVVGAVVAVALFPSAAFGQNPLGRFGWNLIGFALTVGIPFAIAQWLILRYAPSYRKTANLSFLLWWIPVTSIGIACMLLPLWCIDARLLGSHPKYVVVPMLPGMFVLSLFQWLVLYRVIHARFIWVPLTIVGAAIGAVMVSAVVFLGGSEAVGAFVQGLNIAALQQIALVRDLDADLGRGEETHRPVWPLVGVVGLIVVAIGSGVAWWYHSVLRPQREAARAAQAEAAAPNCVATLAPGTVCRDTLKDGSRGPVMMVIPAGDFMMGSPDTEVGRNDNEGPQHRVTVSEFAMGRFEVTFEEYDVFAEATGRERPDDWWGRGNRPVVKVSWQDAVAYAEWLAEQTGKVYRLPSEAEWEYAARSGTDTSYWWGLVGQNHANCDDVGWVCDDTWENRTAPVGSFDANAFGLHDVAGNVSERVQDCWHDDYWGAPADGSPWEVEPGSDCARRVVRGGSWASPSEDVRSAYRYMGRPNTRHVRIGFRLARDL